MKRRDFLALAGAAAPRARAGQSPALAPPAGGSLRFPATLRYGVSRGAVTIANGTFYNNRPLYCAHVPAAVLGGDRPLLRFIGEHQVHGTFAAALVRGRGGKWLHEFADVRFEYRSGHITWRLRDPSLAGVLVLLDAYPLPGVAGFTVRAMVDGTISGDHLLWMFGGAHPQRNVMWAFDPVLAAQDDAWEGRLSSVLFRGVEPEMCRGNSVRTMSGGFRLKPPEKGSPVIGLVSAGKTARVDAAAYRDVAHLFGSAARELPAAAGRIELQEGAAAYWEIAAGREPGEPESTFMSAAQYARNVADRVATRTPDARLDAAVNAANHAVDAVYYPPVFRHGCMAWNVRLPGWRTLYGGTTFGWHERVIDQARFYIASQEKSAAQTEADSDPETRLCNESKKSRLWGRGRIVRDSSRYDFQSQMFDQLIHAWRWTGTEDLEKLLRPALELHAEWMKDCFDPDGDGLYESYINTWPSDTVWYNGGGSVEESSYAYTVHRALEEMSRRAGDSEGADRHARQAGKIRRALFDALWVKDKGHFAAYVEQGGHRRVHEDAWLYSQFLPLDAGLASFEQSLEALYYTEWALENAYPPFGGRRVWTSNWVPSKWSARELYHGDNYHLALAYFQSGWAEEGWKILLGNLLDAGFAKVVPGAQALPEGGCDFNDVLGPFCRVVVEGLFGLAPDYPNNRVRIRPGLPAEWPAAHLRTPDFAIEYRRETGAERYGIALRRDAEVEFAVPVSAAEVRRVLINGWEAEWTAEPGVGCTVVRTKPRLLGKAELTVELGERIAPAAVLSWSGRAGEVVRFGIEGEVSKLDDRHGVLEGPRVSGGLLEARCAARPGHHLVMLKVKRGELEQWQLIKIHVEAPPALRPIGVKASAAWQPVDISEALNGDIRGIFKERYLSPRPKTVSVRIGVDGYSPWTFAPWKIDVPEIELEKTGRVVTPEGVPFTIADGAKNIAFTSLWDNWPAKITVPLGRPGEAVWLLVCGSTNPMQTRIANAVLMFDYADGVTERLELVPPMNFWSLCHLGGRDYLYERDGFCLPKEPPPAVQLGRNCRAMVLVQKLRPGAVLQSVTLEALSQEVVIGLMGMTVMA